MEKNKNNHSVTSRDLFGSIPRPIDVDPFEGIDMKAITVSKPSPEDEEAVEIDKLYPLDGFDFSDIGNKKEEGLPKNGLLDTPDLEGIDASYVSIKPGPKAPRLTRSDTLSYAEEGGMASPDNGNAGKGFSAESGISWTGVLYQKMRGLTDHFLKSVKRPPQAASTAQNDSVLDTGPDASEPTAPPTAPSRVPANGQADSRSVPGVIRKPLPKKFSLSPSRPLSPGLIRKGYVYAEINRIRENLVSSLEMKHQKTVVFTSPHDQAGNTFLISLLAFNVSYFTSLKTLLVDLNMRRPMLHAPFGLKQEGGFTEVVSGDLNWHDAIKDTGLARMKILTAGKRDNELYLLLTPAFLEKMIAEMKSTFDLIFVDTSPLLVQNRNNVDPVFLSLTCDMVILIVQDKLTTVDQLNNAVSAITREGGKLSGVVYNRFF